MIIPYEGYVLFVEPTAPASPKPLIDELTRKMAGAWRASKIVMHGRGDHRCVCGALSDYDEHALPNGWETNSLCVHYLAHHRDEVPESELDKVRALTYREAEPTPQELQSP